MQAEAHCTSSEERELGCTENDFIAGSGGCFETMQLQDLGIKWIILGPPRLVDFSLINCRINKFCGIWDVKKTHHKGNTSMEVLYHDSMQPVVCLRRLGKKNYTNTTLGPWGWYKLPGIREDVKMFSLKNPKPFREQWQCRTPKTRWPLTSQRGSENMDKCLFEQIYRRINWNREEEVNGKRRGRWQREPEGEGSGGESRTGRQSVVFRKC